MVSLVAKKIRTTNAASDGPSAVEGVLWCMFGTVVDDALVV
jgi:hypothetical protein